MERVEIVEPHAIDRVDTTEISPGIVTITYIGIGSVYCLSVDDSGLCEGEKCRIVLNIIDCLFSRHRPGNVCEVDISDQQDNWDG